MLSAKSNGAVVAARDGWSCASGLVTPWGMPGGAIHDGESVEAAAHREATEEIWPVPAYHVTGTERQAGIHRPQPCSVRPLAFGGTAPGQRDRDTRAVMPDSAASSQRG